MIASSQDSVTRNACHPAPRPLPSPGARLRLRGPPHRLRAEDRDGDRGVGGLVVQRALLRLQGLQVGLLGVDLVLHHEQVPDRARVREQRPELGDRRLVGGDPAGDVGHLLGHVLRLLLEGQPRAQAAAGQLAERRGVHRRGDLELDRRGGLGRVVRVAARVLRRDVTARRGNDRRRAGDRRADVTCPHGELRGVDELLACRREPRRDGGLPGARLALEAARRQRLRRGGRRARRRRARRVGRPRVPQRSPRCLTRRSSNRPAPLWP